MIRRIVVLLALLALAAVLAWGASVWVQQHALKQVLNVEDELLLEVNAGSTPSGLLKRLEEQNILQQAFWLRVYWRLNHAEDPLHKGEYRLTKGMTAQNLLDVWLAGEVVQYSVTLVPGWNFRQLRAALEQQDALNNTQQGRSDAQLMEAIGAKGRHPEGLFFPDTYRYVRGMQDTDLLKQAYQRLEQVLDQEWQGRAKNLPYQAPYEALIMASIIERETGVAHERAEISGVFVRRLKMGMLLQTDPTVIYGMGTKYQGKITRTDLRTPTPYNTYVNAGLTPTPIALVGREAIHAALHPRPGKSLYFVARGDGTHVFSQTLSEHNKAVREYQLKRRTDYRSSPAPKPTE